MAAAQHGAAAGHLRPGDDPAHDAAPHHAPHVPSTPIPHSAAGRLERSRSVRMMAPGVAASNAAACASVSIAWCHPLPVSVVQVCASERHVHFQPTGRGVAVTQNCRWPRRFRWVTRRFVNVTVPSRDDDAAVAAAATSASASAYCAHRAPGRLPSPLHPLLVRPRVTETVSVQGKVRAEFWAQRTRVSVRGWAAARARATPIALRVLCLHGFTQNGETFRQRTGSIRKQLKKKIDFVLSTRRTMRRGRSETTTRPRLEPRATAWAPGRGGSSGERRRPSLPRARRATTTTATTRTTSSSAAPVRPVQSRQIKGWDDAAAVIADAAESRTLRRRPGFLAGRVRGGARARARAVAEGHGPIRRLILRL